MGNINIRIYGYRFVFLHTTLNTFIPSVVFGIPMQTYTRKP